MAFTTEEREKLKDMTECKHIYICTSKNNYCDSEMRSNERILCCIKCGVTNLYDEADLYEVTPFEKMIGEIFYMTKTNGIVVKGTVVDDITSVKQKYNEILESHPDASNEKLAQYLSYSLVESSKQKSKVKL